MKKALFIFILMSVTCTASFSQIRLHLMGGFANYTGDIQQKRFTLNQAKGVITAGGTYNLSQKFALRSDYSFGKIGASDKFNTTQSVKDRNLSFETILREFSIMGEYDLFDLTETPFTPYVFGGVSVFKFSPYTYNAAGTKVYLQGLGTEGQGLPQYPDRQLYKKTQLAIPFGGGLKYAISDDIHLGVELGIRKTFTDYLDDVSTTYADENVLLNGRGTAAVDVAFRGDELKTNPYPYPAEGTIRGGKAKDYFYFGQVRLSFRLPWIDGGNSGKRGKYGCPANVL